MMKMTSRSVNLIVVALAIVALCAGVEASTVKKVGLAQALGCAADFDAGINTLIWSGGGGGWIMLDDWTTINFDDAGVTATFTVLQDTSSGGQAEANFSISAWSVTLQDGGADRLTVSGTLYGSNKYYEEETEVNSDFLKGKAIVKVTSLWYDANWFLNEKGISDLGWEGDDVAGVLADITLPQGTNIIDYQSDYASTNVIITVVADESLVPEPATICLLGLGAMVLIRKRRA
jgi:hypothetical protein